MGRHLWEDQSFSSSMREDLRGFYEKIIRSSLLEDLLLFFTKKKKKPFDGLLWVFDTKTLWFSKRQPSDFYTNTFLPSVRSVCDLLYKPLVAFYVKKDCRTLYEDLRAFSTQIFRYSMRRLSSLL